MKTNTILVATILTLVPMIGCDNSSSDDEKSEGQISSYVQNNDEVSKDINSSRTMQFPSHEELEEMFAHGRERMIEQGWTPFTIQIPPIDPNDYHKFQEHQVDSPPRYEVDSSIFGKIVNAEWGVYENGIWNKTVHQKMEKILVAGEGGHFDRGR